MSDPRWWGPLKWPFLEAAARHPGIPVEVHCCFYETLPTNLPCHSCGDSLCGFQQMQPILPWQNMPLWVHQLRTSINVRNEKPSIPLYQVVADPITRWLPALYEYLSVVFLLYPLRLAECPLRPLPLRQLITQQYASVAEQRHHELSAWLVCLNRILTIMQPGLTVNVEESDLTHGGNVALLSKLWQQEAIMLHTNVDARTRLQTLLKSLTLEAKVSIWQMALARRWRRFQS